MSVCIAANHTRECSAISQCTVSLYEPKIISSLFTDSKCSRRTPDKEHFETTKMLWNGNGADLASTNTYVLVECIQRRRYQMKCVYVDSSFIFTLRIEVYFINEL